MDDAMKPEIFGAEIADTPNAPIPQETENDMTAMGVPRTLPVKWNAYAPGQNYCAQVALVTVMAARGLLKGQSPEQVFSQLMRDFPPDLVWGKAGTHPDQLVRAAFGLGLNCYHKSVSNWYPGGFSNPAMNNQFWEPHRDHVFDLIAKGNPAICLVDAGMMIGGKSNPFTLHYVVAHSYHNGTISICNDIIGGVYSDSRMSFSDFAQAWECRILPTGAPKFFAAFPY